MNNNAMTPATLASLSPESLRSAYRDARRLAYNAAAFAASGRKTAREAAASYGTLEAAVEAIEAEADRRKISLSAR